MKTPNKENWKDNSNKNNKLKKKPIKLIKLIKAIKIKKSEQKNEPVLSYFLRQLQNANKGI